MVGLRFRRRRLVTRRLRFRCHSDFCYKFLHSINNKFITKGNDIPSKKTNVKNGSQVQYYDIVWLSTSPSKDVRSKWEQSSVYNAVYLYQFVTFLSKFKI